jgi:hypothetical protein
MTLTTAYYLFQSLSLFVRSVRSITVEKISEDLLEWAERGGETLEWAPQVIH